MASPRNTLIRPHDDVANAKVVDKDRWTPLHDADRDSLEVAIRKLVAKRADVKAVDKDGWMLLHNVARASREALFGSFPTRVQTLWQLIMTDGRLHNAAQVSLGGGARREWYRC